MKKITAIICALTVFFAFTTGAFAAGELDFLDKEYNNYTASGEFKIVLNKPLDFLSASQSGVDGNLDVQRIAESFLNSTYKLNVACDVSDDYLKAKLYADVSANMPVEISDDLKLSVDSKIKMWTEYDLTDADNPTMRVVITNPVDGKYYLVDYADLAAAAEEEEGTAPGIEEFTPSMTKTDAETMRTILKSAIEGNATVSKAGNTVKIAVKNDKLGDLIADYISGLSKTDYFKNLTGETEMKPLEAIAVNETIKAFAQKIFAENAIEMTYTFGAGDVIEKTDEAINIKLNIFELAKEAGADELDLAPLTKENSDVDLTLSASFSYSSVGTTEVIMPTLTEENSVSVFDKIKSYYDDYDYDCDEEWDYNEWYESYSTWVDVDYSDLRKLENGDYAVYIAFGDYLENAMYMSPLQGSCDIAEDGAVTLTFTPDSKSETITVKTALGSADYTVDGTAYKANLATKMSEDNMQLYIDSDILQKALGEELEEVNVNYVKEGGIWTPEAHVWFTRPNPSYKPGMDTIGY